MRNKQQDPFKTPATHNHAPGKCNKYLASKISIFVFMPVVSISNEVAIYLGQISFSMWDHRHHFPISILLWFAAFFVCTIVSMFFRLCWEFNHITLKTTILILIPAIAVFAAQQLYPKSQQLGALFLFTFLLQTIVCFIVSTRDRYIMALATFISGAIGGTIAFLHVLVYNGIT